MPSFYVKRGHLIIIQMKMMSGGNVRSYIFLFTIFFISRVAVAQQDRNDFGQADNVALEIGYFQANNQNLNLTVEAWVYSDNPILSFISGFKWDNAALHLDSVKPAAILSENNLTVFLYYHDSYFASNDNQIFTLGGFSTGSSIESYPESRRLWATYYFTLENWNPNDSLVIDILSAEKLDFEFVREGPYYPIGYKPLFLGALRISGIPTDINETESELPQDFLLAQNYPNPFILTTTLEFSLPKKSHTLLEIFNIEGKKVQTLVDQVLSAGPHKFEWNASFSDNTKAPTGIYFYRLKSGEYEKSNKMILTK